MEYINKEKIKKIKLEADNMYVVMDFDGTMTVKASADSWDAAGYMLGEEFRKKTHDLYELYRPIELSYKISFEEKNKAMEEWYQTCMDLYYEYDLSKEMLEESVKKSGLKLRKGVKEFLIQMHEKNVPVIMISAGIGNAIEIFLKQSNCYFENMYIISNFLTFDENGKIKPYTAQLIHTMNKTMEGHLPTNIAKKLKNRKYKLLFGDTIEDKKMIDEKEYKNTILVGFLNENIEENLEKYKEEFDICYVGDAPIHAM